LPEGEKDMKHHLEKLNSRPLSWSSLSSWEWNKEEWAKKYLEGIETPPSEEMKFGSRVGKKLETDPTYLPMIPRHSKMEHEFKVNIGGIELVGYADTFCTITNKKLGEYKTGNVKNPWNQLRVDYHFQLDMYLLLNYITNKVKPEDVDVFLAWMPTKKTETGDFKVVIDFVPDIENNIKIFKTKRTMVEILKFAGYIKKTYKEMEKYALAYKGSV
jgi:hypothetical protein